MALMMPRYPVRARAVRFVMAAVLALAAACSNRPPDDPEEYAERVAAGRAAKDSDFQKSNDVVPANKKTEFLPLAYFPVDPTYNVVAGLKRSTDPTTMMMPTSTGQSRRVRQLGTMEFMLKGEPMSLVSYIEIDAPDLNRLTLMFSDMTSGTETYAAGRYIDLERTATDLYSLDFNQAYHPYCYYNPTYDCPLPPPQNRLKVPIHAGERMKKPAEAPAK